MHLLNVRLAAKTLTDRCPRVIIAVVSVAVLTVGLAGCGNNPDSAAGTASSTPTQAGSPPPGDRPHTAGYSGDAGSSGASSTAGQPPPGNRPATAGYAGGTGASGQPPK